MRFILLTHFEAVLVVRTDTEKPERVTSRSKYAGRVFSKGKEQNGVCAGQVDTIINIMVAIIIIIVTIIIIIFIIIFKEGRWQTMYGGAWGDILSSRPSGCL